MDPNLIKNFSRSAKWFLKADVRWPSYTHLKSVELISHAECDATRNAEKCRALWLMFADGLTKILHIYFPTTTPPPPQVI